MVLKTEYCSSEEVTYVGISSNSERIQIFYSIRFPAGPPRIVLYQSYSILDDAAGIRKILQYCTPINIILVEENGGQ